MAAAQISTAKQYSSLDEHMIAFFQDCDGKGYFDSHPEGLLNFINQHYIPIILSYTGESQAQLWKNLRARLSDNPILAVKLLGLCLHTLIMNNIFVPKDHAAPSWPVFKIFITVLTRVVGPLSRARDFFEFNTACYYLSLTVRELLLSTISVDECNKKFLSRIKHLNQLLQHKLEHKKDVSWHDIFPSWPGIAVTVDEDDKRGVFDTSRGAAAKKLFTTPPRARGDDSETIGSPASLEVGGIVLSGIANVAASPGDGDNGSAMRVPPPVKREGTRSSGRSATAIRSERGQGGVHSSSSTSASAPCS